MPLQSRIQIARGLEAGRTAVTPNAGEFLFTTDEKKLYVGDGSTAGGLKFGIVWAVPHTYAIGGNLATPPSVVPMTMRLAAGQTATLIGVTCSIASGTSIAVTVRKNAANITGLVGIPTTTTPASNTPSSNTTFVEGDELDLVLASAVGSPTDLSVSIEFGYMQDIVAY